MSISILRTFTAVAANGRENINRSSAKRNDAALVDQVKNGWISIGLLQNATCNGADSGYPTSHHCNWSAYIIGSISSAK